ncbi:MAG TPA: D-glycero-beta-D-manno-heptose-7-phosphate kinase [Burkholderiales bacterium]|nr:D-glycero-beta-D-manno-heptose-7-phosphate kinase [Burkholderiales bacterium]
MRAEPNFLELIGRFAGKRMLVIGDLMLDEFIWGRVSRISPEAPVPVVSVTGESEYPGGAANVARNLREFTSETFVMGLVGADPHGQNLIGLLEAAGIGTTGVLQDSNAATTVKTRVIARNQQVVRVDRERKTILTSDQLGHAREYLEHAIPRMDGVVVADYGKGFLTQPLADEICRLARRHAKVLAVDPHPHTSLVWRGATAIKPNRIEAFTAVGLPPADPVEPACRDEALLEAARRLNQLWETRSLLVTLGEQGMLLFDGEAEPVHLPARAHEVFDVSGAGDTAIALFTLGLVAGATPAGAAELANRASGIVVGKIGTATVTPAELIAAFEPA